MSWYKSDAGAWKEIIETVAAEEHRTTQMVEKDTIQSMFLLELPKRVYRTGMRQNYRTYGTVIFTF